jgi:serine kinase of HPr protein (carbohydrate metabolism regulator)
MSQTLVHASCVAIDGEGVLLTGPPGIGKSDLALRLIDGGAQLVADDQTILQFENNQLVASSPSSIAGMMEIRHVGLLRLPFRQSARVALNIALVAEDQILERCPEFDQIFLLDQPLRRIRLKAYESSSPAKIRAVLTHNAVE